MAKQGMFASDPAFADLTPIPQDDGPNPACPIAYSPDFVDAMDYFRAVLAAEEYSQRALDVTTAVIELNPANYTVWHFRRLVLDAVKADMRAELEFLSELIVESPKNYQVWYHRRAIVQRLEDSSGEMAFTEQILDQDSKNYHAWQHRHWAMAKFDLFGSLPQSGLKTVDTMLDEDVRNNSAWNHRYFIVKHTSGFTQDVAKAEVSYALKRAALAPNNESAWSYIRGCLAAADVPFSACPEVRALCEKLEPEERVSPHVLGTLVDVLRELTGDLATQETTMARIKALCTRLAEAVDPVRKKYWMYRLHFIQEHPPAPVGDQ